MYKRIPNDDGLGAVNMWTHHSFQVILTEQGYTIHFVWRVNLEFEF